MHALLTRRKDEERTSKVHFVAQGVDYESTIRCDLKRCFLGTFLNLLYHLVDMDGRPSTYLGHPSWLVGSDQLCIPSPVVERQAETANRSHENHRSIDCVTKSVQRLVSRSINPYTDDLGRSRSMMLAYRRLPMVVLLCTPLLYCLPKMWPLRQRPRRCPFSAWEHCVP